VVARIGAGGMGEVYKARDARLARDVAIKVLPATLATDPDRQRRFEEEARAIAALNHPHICQIYDVGPGYLVLEYVEGTPLRGPLAADDAVRLALQIAGALEAAHQRGILHRDLKPGNILVRPDGTAKLIDFGLAKTLLSEADVTRTTEGLIAGTAAYMSPEQAQGKPLDARSDVFSFGAVLYEVLSGQRAFPGDTSAEVLSAVLRDEPRSLGASPLAQIAGRCLEKDASRRYQTMEEVRGALEEVSRAQFVPKASIAVLPFADMSSGKDNEYFSDGLAEEIINALAQVAGLKVIARTSAFAFKGQNTDVRRIAETLGVTNILEGSVRKAGNRIRVTAQLIAAVDGSHVWSQRYDRELEDVFAVQDEIATAIAEALQVRLSAGPRRYTPNLAAYEAFLKGRHHWAKLTPDSLARSRECYEQAVALDPQFALARTALAEHFFALTANGLMPGREAIPRVRAGALAALEIAPALAEAHALLGVLAATVEYDWNEAARRFHLATAREPVLPYARWMRGQSLSVLGRFREAAEEMERALQEDPLHHLCRSQFADCLHAVGRCVEASQQIRQVLEIDERFWVAHWYLATFQAVEGELTAALRSAETAYSLVSSTATAGLFAGILTRSGEAARAEAVMAQFGSPESYGMPVGWALYKLFSMDTNEATEWLEKAIEQRDCRIIFLLRHFRGCARWPEVADMMNLPV
jgi:serine/threonine-protein kinase